MTSGEAVIRSSLRIWLWICIVAGMGYYLSHATHVAKSEQANGRTPIDLEDWKVDKTLPPLINFIYSEKLLEAHPEPAIVTQAKQLIGGDLQQLYFTDLWQIFKYLEKKDVPDDIEKLMAAALKNGWLNANEDCINFLNCASRINGNITEGNARDLSDLLVEAYRSKAIDAIESGDDQKARQIAKETLFVLRDVDTPISDASNFSLSKTYVLSIFMILTDKKNIRDQGERLRILEQNIDGDSTKLTGNVYMDGYIGGMNFFKNKCYSKAARHFVALLSQTNFDYLQELYSFLALRSLYEPLIDLNALTIDEVQKTVFVHDCNQPVSLSDWRTQRDEVEKLVISNIRHPGFLSDVAEYRAHLPDAGAPEQALFIQVAGTARDKNAKLRDDAVVKPVVAAAQDAATPVEENVVATPEPETTTDAAPDIEIKPDHNLAWPAVGKVIGEFGDTYNGSELAGIDIELAQFSPVKAVEAGTVIYAGNGLKNLGVTVLLRHDDGTVTVFGYLATSFVERGQKVTKGQVIGKSGTDLVSQKQSLHFEIRKNASPVDPIPYLEVQP